MTQVELDECLAPIDTGSEAVSDALKAFASAYASRTRVTPTGSLRPLSRWNTPREAQKKPTKQLQMSLLAFAHNSDGKATPC